MPKLPLPKRPTVKLYHFLSLLFTAALILAFFRIHSRIQITLLGYEIGRLKELEEKLLKKRSQLTMELAKITTREHLLALSQKERPSPPPKDSTTSKP